MHATTDVAYIKTKANRMGVEKKEILMIDSYTR